MMGKIGQIFWYSMKLIPSTKNNNLMKKILERILNFSNTSDFIVLNNISVVKFQISKCMVLYFTKIKLKMKDPLHVMLLWVLTLEKYNYLKIKLHIQEPLSPV